MCCVVIDFCIFIVAFVVGCVGGDSSVVMMVMIMMTYVLPIYNFSCLFPFFSSLLSPFLPFLLYFCILSVAFLVVGCVATSIVGDVCWW